MRLVSSNYLTPGMILAKTLYSDRGSVLIGADVELTATMIKRIEKLGIGSLYIKDKRTEDLQITETIPLQIRNEAILAIRKSFLNVKSIRKRCHIFFSGELEQSIRPILKNIFDELDKNEKAIDLLSRLFVSDEYVFNHSYNVTVYSVAIGLRLGLTQTEIIELGIGSILHDIGKMQVPEEILQKKGSLTNEEFDEIKKHPEYGFNILKNQENIPLVSAHIAYQHHERLNGSGYPRGLKQDAIHFYAQIVAVADVYDAMTSNRVYRHAQLPNDAMEFLYASTGTLFNQKIVEAFRNVIAIYPLGLMVQLSTGYFGVVVDHNKDLPSHPIVRILKDESECEVEPFEIDLSKQLNIVIKQCLTSM